MVDDLFLKTPVFSYNGGSNEGPEVPVKREREGGGGGAEASSAFPASYVELAKCLICILVALQMTPMFPSRANSASVPPGLYGPIQRDAPGFCPPQIVKAGRTCEITTCPSTRFFRGKGLVDAQTDGGSVPSLVLRHFFVGLLGA